MSRLMMGGFILVALGLVGFAIPVFTTQKTENVLQVGDVKLQATETTPHNVPPLLSSAVMVLGIMLVGAGLYNKA